MATGKSFNLKKQKMPKESIRIIFLGSRRSSERISLIVLILNREVKLTCREKNHSLLSRFISLNETPPRRSIRYGGELETPKHLRQKKNSIVCDIAGKGRNSVLHYNFTQEFVPMRRSQESSSLNSLKVKANTCCLVSRHSVSVRQNSSSKLENSGSTRYSQVRTWEERSMNSECGSVQRSSGIMVLQGGSEPWGVKVSVENFMANPKCLNRQDQEMTLKPEDFFWSIQGDVIYRHHNERISRSNLCRKEETFPTPLKYVDVTWSTHTDLGVMQEKCMDDNWNIDENRSLSDSWKGFTKIVLLREKPPKGYMWPGERLTKILTTTWQIMRGLKHGPELGKPPKNKTSKKKAIEKPKLDDARRLRGINSIDPEDEEHKEIMKNARGKLEVHMDAAMPCKKRSRKVCPALRQLERRLKHPTIFHKQNMLVWWKLTNPRGNVWNHLCRKITKITLQAKDMTRWHMTI